MPLLPFFCLQLFLVVDTTIVVGEVANAGDNLQPPSMACCYC
jgi:hypothetical protein